MRMELSFPNPGNRLRPGQFGKVRAVIKVAKGAVVIPEQSVTELQGNRLVAVVDSENKIAMRPVKMGERSAGMWQVIQGLKPGEKVVVQGLLKVRPGSPVTVKEWTPPAEEVASTNSPPAKKP
jgi:membrane fusion protein (multidrug efflux system)